MIQSIAPLDKPLILLFKVHGTFLQSQYQKGKRFKFKMQQNVKVTEFFFPGVSLGELFSNLGGVVGLWLGVGMMQVADHGFKITSYFRCLNSMKKK